MSICAVEVDGLVISEPIVKISYGIENIREVKISYKRLSGKKDNFLVYFSEGLNVDLAEGKYIKVKGELRSTIIKDSVGIFPKVYILAKEIEILDKEPEQYENNVEITEGILTETPKLRKSYNGDDVDIAEVGVKIPRHNNKLSKIMCTTWNNNARLISKYGENDLIDAEGRLQSHDTKYGNILVQVALSSVQVYTKE